MKALMLTLLFCLVLTSSFSQKIDPAPPGKSVVYFVRPSAMGFAINFSYFDSTKLIARFNGGKYIRYECEPGKHLFWARSENRVFMESDLEPGKIYFLKASPQMGMMKAQVGMAQVDPNDPKVMKNIFKMMAKKPAETFTEAQIADASKDLQNVVERGMAKYKEDKAGGKNILQLDKSKFYNESATVAK